MDRNNNNVWDTIICTVLLVGSTAIIAKLKDDDIQREAGKQPRGWLQFVKDAFTLVDEK